MIRILSAVIGILAASLSGQPGGDPVAASKAPTVEELVAKLRERQRDAESIVLEMVSEGSFPGGPPFRIEGTIRVLGSTHVHVSNVSTFEDGIVAEQETVKTPEGVWIRERDPAFGTTYMKMDPELVEQLERATAVLGAEGGGAEPADGAPGMLQNKAKDPLGAAMLESLSRSYDLGVERRVIKGEEYCVVKGDLKTEAREEAAVSPSSPDRVELLIRTSDLVIAQMSLLNSGREITKVRITKMQLGAPMSRESFRIALPEGVRFIDVMDHLPAATQIQYVLNEARQAEAARQGGAAKQGEGKD